MAAAVRHAAGLNVDDPLDLSCQIGTINSENQLFQVLSFVRTAQVEGGEVTLGGERVLAESGGSYMAPTIVTGVTQAFLLFQKKTFAPILAMNLFANEAEAILLGNGTDLAFAASVWTANLCVCTPHDYGN